MRWRGAQRGGERVEFPLRAHIGRRRPICSKKWGITPVGWLLAGRWHAGQAGRGASGRQVRPMLARPAGGDDMVLGGKYVSDFVSGRIAHRRALAARLSQFAQHRHWSGDA
jgi:hypothetical protein